MVDSQELKNYQDKVKAKLASLRDIFAKASVGDFSQNISIPKEEDEFTELYVGIQVMLEVIREQLEEVNTLNQSLQEKVVQLEEVDRMKTEFISLAAHQLRNPLSKMRWNVELLLKDQHTLPQEFQPKITRLHDDILQMIQLVSELLDVSRITQGMVPDQPEAVNLVKLARAEIAEITGIADEKAVKLNLTVDDSIPDVFVDPNLMKDVLQNLLSNALKFNLTGGEVTVSIHKRDGFIHVSVADTGIGIPTREQSKVFSKFFRAENAVSLKTEGTGLGLFLVKSYIDRWRGRIWFESPTRENDRGTTFHIELPLELTHQKTHNKIA